MKPKTKSLVTSVLLSIACGSISHADEPYNITDNTAEKQLDVLQSGKLIGRFMYDFDKSTGPRREDTFKTYLQIYNPEGTKPISKGLGGEANHHRGVFTGFGKITIGGETFDCWHGHGAAQIHQDFSGIKADSDGASFTSRMFWERAKNGPPALEEKRTMSFVKPPEPAYGMLDFTSEIISIDGSPVILDGDPEHSGIQFRAPAEVDLKKTLYLYPKENADAHKDLDYPWLACSFVNDGETYTVVFLNNPKNTKGALFSAYRDYARFGPFFKGSIEKEEKFVSKVRLIFLNTELPSAKWIQKQYNAYTGTEMKTPMTTEKGPS